MLGHRFAALTTALLLILSLIPVVAAAPVERVEVLIQFTASPSRADLEAVTAVGGAVTRQFSIVPAVAATIPGSAATALQRNPRVALVEPDSLLYALEYRSSHDWGIGHINADDVHATGNVGSGVRVAVIDSGIDCEHLELALRCQHGWDYVANEQNADDDYGHGTHVAGSIGATLHVAADGSPATSGVVGVAPGATVVAYKTLDSGGVGAWSRHIAAIDDIWNGGSPTAQVVNMSIGRGDYSSTAELAFQRAYDAGILLVAAAGNSGRCNGRGNSVAYPALFESVIAVAAVDSSNQRPCWSSTGDKVELTAPGLSVFSTWPADMSTSYRDPQPVCEDGDGDQDADCHYKYGSGTSMSSPHVAGAAALVLASATLADADGYAGVANELRQRLADTALDLGASGRDPQYGYGLVDAAAAVAASGGGDGGDGGGGEEPPPPDASISLSAAGYKVKGDQKVDLSWGGATSTSVDVYRDGALLTITANDGAHTDHINLKGGGSYTYRVCEAGTSTCSNDATVTF